MAQRAPAYCDSSPDCAALDLISLAGFSEGSDLYRRLVIDSQWVEDLWANRVDHIDPFLFIVTARVKQAGRLAEVRRAIEEELARFAAEPLAEERLEAVKSHLRYSFVLSMDRSEAVAAALAPYIGLRRTPETVSRIFARYAEAAPADLVRVARAVLHAAVAHGGHSRGEAAMKVLCFPDDSPALSLRLVFLTGSACDPPGREGSAWLAGHMLASGGTRRRTYKQILDFLFPRGRPPSPAPWTRR